MMCGVLYFVYQHIIIKFILSKWRTKKYLLYLEQKMLKTNHIGIINFLNLVESSDLNNKHKKLK